MKGNREVAPRQEETQPRLEELTRGPAGVKDSLEGAQGASPRAGAQLLMATKVFASEVRWRSWWHMWTTMAVLVCACVGTVLPMIPWIPRAIISCLAGLTMVRMFIIYHDYQHGTILRRSRLAQWILNTYGILIMSPPSSWKPSHNHHHKNNAKLFGAFIGSYPVMTTEAYAKATRRERFVYAVTRHPLTILFGYLTVFVYGMCLKSLISEPRKHVDCAVAVGIQVALVVLLACFAPAILFFTLLAPIALAAALGAYLFYSQHNFPGVKMKPRQEWDHVYAALYSSSYTAMGPILSWFTGNIGYHHVHHLNAHIPFYRLPEAMAHIRELQVPGSIRLNVLDVWRCLRLKLWDPEKNRMVSFRGV